MGKRKKQAAGFVKKQIRRFHWNSVTVLISLALVFIVLTTASLAFAALEYLFHNAAVQISVQSNQQMTKNIQKNIDSYMEEMLTIADKTGEVFQKSIHSGETDRVEFLIRKDIDTIAIFDSQGEPLLKSDSRSLKPQVEVEKEQWFQEALEMESKVEFSAPHVQRLYRGTYPWVISMVKKVSYKEGTGVMLVDLNFTSIKELCTTKDISEGEIYILDQDGNVIYHPNQQMLYAGIRDESIAYAAEMENETKEVFYGGESHIISAYRLSSNGWSVVSVNEMKWFELLIENIRYSAAGIMAGILAFAGGLAAVSAVFIVRPLKKLMHLMQKAREGDFSVRADTRGYYEVVGLTQSFNSMIDQISRLLERIREEHKRLRKSEMKTLHEQINSHFLYNTLDSVIWMAEVDDRANAIRMLKALSRFFRLSLSQGKEIIPVEMEVQHVENYLIIQKMRYGDSFEYFITVDEEVRMVTTLKMVLQPIVENSISHGLNECQGEGRIEIRCIRKEGKLLLSVEDNGCGIPDWKLEHILETDAANKSGVGLKNVNERIQMMFGKEYGLRFFSRPDQGTRVEIWLPAEQEEEER